MNKYIKQIVFTHSEALQTTKYYIYSFDMILIQLLAFSRSAAKETITRSSQHVSLFALCSQPFNDLVDVGAVKGTDGQDHPRGLHDVVQLKLFNEFGLSNMW